MFLIVSPYSLRVKFRTEKVEPLARSVDPVGPPKV